MTLQPDPATGDHHAPARVILPGRFCFSSSTPYGFAYPYSDPYNEKGHPEEWPKSLNLLRYMVEVGGFEPPSEGAK